MNRNVHHRQQKYKTHNTHSLLGENKENRPTWKHSEDGGEGIKFESINDIAGVDELQTHEAETHHQKNNVQHLRNQRQPQHPCKKGDVWLQL